MDISLHCRLPGVDRNRLYLHLERRLGYALGRFADRLSGAAITLDDVNGPKGGTDVEARAEVHVLPHGRVLVQGRFTTPDTAVDGLCHKLKWALRRHLDRTRAGAGDRTSLAGS